MRNIITLSIVTLLVIVISACTPAPTPTSAPTPTEASPTGNVNNGRQIFTQGVDPAPACSTCHFVVSGQTGFNLGPNLAGIEEIAGTRVEGLSAEEYLHQSIVDPLNYVVPGYRDAMYPDYAAHLSEQDIQDVIAYLLSLEA